MQLVNRMKIVTGLAPVTPSSTTPDYVSLKGYDHLTIVIKAKNATTVTGSAITLLQATSVAGSAEKALAFTKMWANADTAASDALTATDVTSNTFTTATTNSKDLLYVIEVKADQLDTNGGFDCVRVGTANATATVLDVTYILHGARYNGTTMPAAITD
jgi:hypothetical protein